MENEELPSDSDQSDEDFCPEDAVSDVSEEESGSDVQSEHDAEEKPQKNKKKKNLNKNSEETKASVRSTRTTISCQEDNVCDKDNLESDEDDDKERRDALWTYFLNDTNSSVNTNSKSTQKENEILESKSNLTKITENVPKADVKVAEASLGGGNVKVTEVLEFAGEEIKITKEIPIDNNKSKNLYIGNSTTSKVIPKFSKAPMKRTAASGLGSILGQIGKKNKISVLEKSKLDWEGFKKNEGLSEELQTFNKGKDGYLERQDFLQRTDLRQFEIEKNLRQNKRNN